MRDFWKVLASIAAAIVAAFSLCSVPFTVASAETTSSSPVMDDLRSGTSFSESDYPSMTVDEMKAAGQAELEVIRIGESIDDQLYLYIYQPTDATKEIEATYVKMLKSSSDLEWNVLPLRLVSTEGVFDKYLVEGVKVRSDLSERFYEITSIFRPFDEDLDEGTGNNNTNSNVDVGVGQTWKTRQAADGKTEYGYTEEEVIRVTSEYHGYIRYSDGWKWVLPYTDSHFMAFTTDFQIDELKSAKIYFKEHSYAKYYCEACGLPIPIGDAALGDYKTAAAPVDVEIFGDEVGGNDADGWIGARKYEWQRIEKLSDFVANEQDLSQEALKELMKVAGSNSNTAWVLRFYETPYQETWIPIGNHRCWASLVTGAYQVASLDAGVRVQDVTLVELTFVTSGKPYVMGVVDSMTTEGEDPSGEATLGENISRDLNDIWIKIQQALRVAGLVLGGILILFAIFGIIKLVAYLRLVFGRNNGGGNAGGT